MNTLSHRHTTFGRKTVRTSLFDMLAIYRQRRALARLDAHALKDIGLSRDEALTEANRPIWDINR